MLNSRPASQKIPAQRAFLRAGLLATVVGAALASSGPAATAAEQGSGASDTAAGFKAAAEGLTAPVSGTVSGTGRGLGESLTVVKKLPLNPMANTGSDPLNNAVATQVADFREVSTAALTGPLARGATLTELPLVGPVVGTAIDTLPH
ncbi:hypothetical protein OHB04_13700 [Streptomyces sp. NBC_01775]|uniref:hypothetical protein n=1 Tax=Streptomyces sp. NBC_01775 TaxID=2975939 RepID=UPI002DDA91A9|nr:hypothetical protein [Streptomyces sp. NBC_01775]WSB76729.1 hypothetical protein OHB04_13700 [Streptomyces sp. NBC_01775]